MYYYKLSNLLSLVFHTTVIITNDRNVAWDSLGVGIRALFVVTGLIATIEITPIT